jgi:hypothetical protein
MHEEPIALLYSAVGESLRLLLRRVISCLGIYATSWTRFRPPNIALSLSQNMRKLMRKKPFPFGGLWCISSISEDHVLSKCVR